MEWHRLPGNAELLRFTDKIAAIHKDHASSHPCTPEGNFMGALGERQLAYIVGGDMDLRLLPGGDDHIDIMLQFKDGRRLPADTKLARNPYWLLVEKAYLDDIPPERETIFVLGRLLNADRPKLEWGAELLKWEYASILRQSTPMDKGGKGIVSYWRKADDCHDIYELLALVERQWGRGA